MINLTDEEYESIMNRIRYLEDQIERYNDYIKKAAQADDDLGHAANGVIFMQGQQLPNVKSLCVKGIDPETNLLSKLEFTKKDMPDELNSAKANLVVLEEKLETECRIAQGECNSLYDEIYWG